MPKRRWAKDDPVSLHGVSFEAALAGVLAAKPPEGQEAGQAEKKATAEKEQPPKSRKRKK